MFILSRILTDIFFPRKSFVKFFWNFKLESDFFPPFLSKIRKIENCENFFLLNFKCAKFQRNRGQKNSSLHFTHSLHSLTSLTHSKLTHSKLKLTTNSFIHSQLPNSKLTHSKLYSLQTHSLQIYSIQPYLLQTYSLQTHSLQTHTFR